MPIAPAFAVSVSSKRVVKSVVAAPRYRGLRGAGIVCRRAVRIREQGRHTRHDVPGVAPIVRPKQVADAGPKVRRGRDDNPRVARVGQHVRWAGECPGRGRIIPGHLHGGRQPLDADGLGDERCLRARTGRAGGRPNPGGSSQERGHCSCKRQTADLAVPHCAVLPFMVWTIDNAPLSRRATGRLRRAGGSPHRTPARPGPTQRPPWPGRSAQGSPRRDPCRQEGFRAERRGRRGRARSYPHR